MLYHCIIIQVPDTDFVLALASLVDHTQSDLSVLSMGKTEYYHRIDLFQDEALYKEQLCAQTKSYVAFKGKKFTGDLRGGIKSLVDSTEDHLWK